MNGIHATNMSRIWVHFILLEYQSCSSRLKGLSLQSKLKITRSKNKIPGILEINPTSQIYHTKVGNHRELGEAWRA